MKVLHTPTTRNNRIRAIPVTGNYLVRENSGAYRWSVPNVKWRMFSPTGGQKCLLTNIRRDDTEHSPDLWLYSNITQKEMSRMHGEPDLTTELFEQNRVTLDRSRKWYIRQFVEMDERVGIKRFSGLPLTAFWDMWRTVIPTSDINIHGLANGQMKILYRNYNFNTFLRWPELQSDMTNSQSSITNDETKTKWRLSEKVMPWLHKYCEHGIVLFSDYDVMLPNFEDEFAYIADVA